MSTGTLASLEALYTKKFMETTAAVVESSIIVAFLDRSKFGTMYCGAGGLSYVVPTVVANAGGTMAGWDEGETGITASAADIVQLTFTPKQFAKVAPLTYLAMKQGMNGGLGDKSMGTAVDVSAETLASGFVTSLNDEFVLGGAGKFILNQHKSEPGSAVWQAVGDFAGAAAMLAAKGSALTCNLINLKDYSVISAESISALDADAGTITLAGAADTTSVPAGYGIGVYLTDSTAYSTGRAKSMANELKGLMTVMTEVSYGGVSRNTYSNLRPTVFTVASSSGHDRTALTLSSINKLISRLRLNANPVTPIDLMIINAGDEWVLTNLVQSNITNTNQGAKDAGFAPDVFAGKYNGLSILKDKSTPKGCIFVGSSKALHVASGDSNGPADPTLTEFVLTPKSAGEYTKTALYACSLVARAPHAFGALVGFES